MINLHFLVQTRLLKCIKSINDKRQKWFSSSTGNTQIHIHVTMRGFENTSQKSENSCTKRLGDKQDLSSVSILRGKCGSQGQKWSV